jgi:hypothetical protein
MHILMNFEGKNGTMKRKLVLIPVFLLLLLVLTTSMTTNVSAASASKTACTMYNVGLHGSQPATVTCLHFSKVVNGKIIPSSLTSGACNAGDLQLYADANYSGGIAGNILCLFGYGGVNMADFFYSDLFQSENWNDKLSSYKTGNACAAFYWDSNGQGSSFNDGKYINVSYIGDTWNDQVSSLQRYPC